MKLNLKTFLLAALCLLPLKTFAQSPRGGIRIIEASYGSNVNLGLRGNATRHVSDICSGLVSCQYDVSTRNLGDPARGYQKDFYVVYSCGPQVKREVILAEANGRLAFLDCTEEYRPAPRPNQPRPDSNIIRVRSATYGGNIDTRLEGNATRDVANYCNGKTTCDYFVSTRYLGDPAYGKGKDFTVEYYCGQEMFRLYSPAEANNTRVILRCN